MEILELVNAERAKEGVTPLTIDDNVQTPAHIKAVNMDEKDYFGHKMTENGKAINAEMNDLLVRVSSCVDISENLQNGTRLTEERLKAQ